jgi:hypothetical protein
MPVLSCPHCGHQRNAPTATLGKTIHCPGCRQPFTATEVAQLTGWKPDRDGDESFDSGDTADQKQSRPIRVTAIFHKLAGGCTLALGLSAGVLMFVASSSFAKHGESLTHLRSVGGQTVAEAYYQEVGHFGQAFSSVLPGLGLATIAVSLGLGVSLLTRD